MPDDAQPPQDPPQDSVAPPRRMRLPGFLVEEEIGLGDVIKHATSRVGIRPCGGCQRRADALNRRFVVAPRTSRRHG